MKVFGGFSGTGADCDAGERNANPVTNGTVLSGDVGVGGDSSDNCTIVVTGNSLNTQTELNGFTITGANGGSGAIFLDASSNPTIQDCRVTGNLEPGLYCTGGAQPVVQDCVFDHNTASSGAGIVFAATSGAQTSPQVIRCRFESNVATNSGGAILHGQNGNLNSGAFGTLLVRDCVFIANEARGSGTSAGGGAAWLQTASHARFVQCLFSRNRAFKSGGALWFSNTISSQYFNSDTTLINCTFSGNAAVFSLGGALRIESQAVVTMRNGIAWGNSGNDTDLGNRQISYSGSAPTITWTSIQGYSAAIFPGSGNNGADPLFVNAGSDNLRVRTGSGAIDSSDRSAIPGVGEDLDGSGHARLLDDPNSSNSGPGVPADWMDRGAYEFDRLRNCNSNGQQDNDEIGAGAPDCNRNGVPDDCDLPDCNNNDVPDSCDLASGVLRDCDHDGIPEGCTAEFTDCNGNCINDASEISPSTDCNGNGILDECELASSKFTSNAQFDQGVLINVNHDTADELLRNTAANTKPLPYLWVALTPFKDGSRNEIVKIDTSLLTPAIVGHYRAAPEQHVDATTGIVSTNYAAPSRVAVDLDGSAWVADRVESGNNQGAIVKLGIVIGGTRVNADGTANPTAGKYLAPPYKYCTCEDRDGDGLIRTSMDYNDLLPWNNWDGADDNPGTAGNDNGAVKRADDECIIRYARVPATGARCLAIDANNDVWVGGWINQVHQKVDGFSGLALTGPNTQFTVGSSRGGNNGVIDCQGYLWSTTFSHGDGKLVRINTANVTSQTVLSQLETSYALTIDRDGKTWMTNRASSAGNDKAQRFINTSGVSDGDFPTDGALGDQGIAVTPTDNDVWVANGFGSDVSRLSATTGYSVITTYAMPAPPPPATTAQPSGVAVDSQGRVWVLNDHSIDAVYIDPISGVVSNPPISFPPLDGSTSNVGPDCYGDLTGIVGLMAKGEGTWSVIHDSRVGGTQWCRVTWNTETGCTSSDTRLEVGIRANDSLPAMAMVGYSLITASGSSPSNVRGRYAQVRLRFKGSCPGTAYSSPALCDLTVYPKCLKGDVNLDGKTDGKDIQPFIKRLLLGSSCTVATCQADLNNDGLVTTADIPCFVSILLYLTPGCVIQCGLQASLELGQPQTPDCNGNGVDDVNDIADGTSQDCNHNGIPDECDLNAGDPDGDGKTSVDVNGNSIPDECEPDCNGNGVPDAWDITHGGKADVDGNGVPDECEKDCNHNNVPDSYDISQHTSADCNLNGTADECEQDCNGNGKPDDCDIDPTDPDGNGVTSPDCNHNLYPDECDLTLGPPVGSLDCNANSIPDECDIASGYSQDTNGNHIPDECEGGQNAMAPTGSGGRGSGPADDSSMDDGDSSGASGTMNTAQSAPDLGEAWAELYEWAWDRCWGPDCLQSVEEQFQDYVDKLIELGLPVVGPQVAP